MSRRVGLTANAPGLLKTVGNRPRQVQKPPVTDDAPPLSTDEEDDTFSEGTVQAAKGSDRAASPRRKASHRPLSPIDSDSDTSADERSRRAAIKPTAFSSKNRKEKNTFTKRRRISESPERESPNHKGKLKPGNHLQDKWGFTGQKQTKATYGKRARGSQSSQPGSSQGSNKQLRVPSSIESPQKKKSSKFIMPDKKLLSSPGSSPKKLLTDLNGTADSEDEDSILASLKNYKKKTKKGKKKASPPSSPPPAVFKLPQNFLDKSPGGQVPIRGDVEDLPKLSSDEDDDDDVPKLKIPEEYHEPPATKCPWCGEEVDKAFLDDFSKGKRLNVRMQTRFCQLHKQRTAAQTWKDLDYPDIDWDGIETRFAAHRDHLLAIVEGRGSHFRNIHARNIEEGRARSMKREESFNPGYYGPRGFNAMCDYLVGEFSGALKRRAVDDRVIAGRGSAAFIQAVLVAELGVRLIKDDMKLSETKARQLMEDSKVLGELVQPEIER
ncbi:hypothetical protein LMH87_011659 [Akanthomyces muscarius]|uniref:Restriction of telomere capping protein 4 n=1 Tax=Akanthomyces muscarius TaxID=2231603 RepID=A0A9W8QBR0_AKAMU|nr:hypothetical protein LMH87_011659 [Akanthomyces muscarius]KAJ4150932.1 hypothetical protein LMH87_011659 [Akanthomyces muscarius]